MYVCPAALEPFWANLARAAWVSWQYTPHPQPWPWFSLLQTALLVDYFQMSSRKAHRIDSPPRGLSKSIQYSVGLPEGSRMSLYAPHTQQQNVKICAIHLAQLLEVKWCERIKRLSHAEQDVRGHVHGYNSVWVVSTFEFMCFHSMSWDSLPKSWMTKWLHRK